MPREPVAFWKYEGTANDFVVLEGEGQNDDLDAAEVARLCDRHRGIGADGVLIVSPPTSTDSGAQARMVVRNADGSRPEMCGNGLRCVALHVATRLAEARSISVETDAGVRACRIDMLRSEDGEAEWFVTVDMGRIQVGETRGVPFDGREIAITAADAGNPHAVTFDRLEDAELDTLGARLQKNENFPRGVNLERVTFCAGVEGNGAPKPRARSPSEGVEVEVTVFERGVGRTLACGTGACAVAAVLVARGEAQVGRPITVVLPGGPLQITLDAQGRASMRGPAKRVFAGRIALDASAWKRGE